MNSISDLLKVYLGSFTLGKLLSAALTLAVCILAVRLLNKWPPSCFPGPST